MKNYLITLAALILLPMYGKTDVCMFMLLMILILRVDAI